MPRDFIGERFGDARFGDDLFEIAVIGLNLDEVSYPKMQILLKIFKIFLKQNGDN